MIFINGAAEHKRMVRLNYYYRERRRFGVQPHDVAYAEILPFGNDPIGVVKVAPGQVLKPGVAIEAASVAPYPYEAIYGAFWDRVIPSNAKAVMDASVRRHIEWLNKDAL